VPGIIYKLLQVVGPVPIKPDQVVAQVVAVLGQGASAWVLLTKVWAKELVSDSRAGCSSDAAGGQRDQGTSSSSSRSSGSMELVAPPGCVSPPVEAALKLFKHLDEMPEEYRKKTDFRAHFAFLDALMRREKDTSQAVADKRHVLEHLGNWRLKVQGVPRVALLLERGLCSLADLLRGPGGVPRPVTAPTGAYLMLSMFRGGQQLHLADRAWLDANAGNVILVEDAGLLVAKVADFGWSMAAAERATTTTIVGECQWVQDGGSERLNAAAVHVQRCALSSAVARDSGTGEWKATGRALLWESV
jgi:hypothetical protein